MRQISKNQLLGGLFSIGLLIVTGANADTLYKCEGPGGSVAYTNKRANFTACKAIGRYSVKPPAAKSAQAQRKVEYQEQPDVRAGSSGVTSTAAMLAPAKKTEPVPSEASKPVARVMTSANTSKAAPKVLRGAVYRVERKSGITEYTNVRPRDGRFALLFTYISTCVACDLHSTINFARTALNTEAYKDEVNLAAADYGVDAALLRAVIHAESAFNPMAISSKGAQGLMQLMPGTASDLGVTDAFDVSQNIRGGAKYLAEMLKNFNGDQGLAAAAYNAGPGAVRKYSAVPPYAETQIYVERVKTLYERYRKAL
ncbi:MAG TPA: lytic transglycosylase domain-containing protein [Dokdonella sp.]|uniref:lytic transglycosylase domain-containing protein n=1 Tax=Dokdonella sp. TaxID=2291710 RepID=UPI002D7E8C6F|nr:lytic transglycosylase domain-containing protein [Dokdonella sp.]HET9031672.1 lytic transglycosylase domain-containing protein [Dokdonella sp.]